MTRAQRRKFHYIYKITNKLNGKFYIGMHSTDDLNDGYFGSGKYLWYSIRKHGKESHEMGILEFLPSREELKKREAEIVNEEMLKHPLCMNLKFGGEGGWDHVNDGSGSVQSLAGKVGGKACWAEHREKLTETAANTFLEARKSKDWNSMSFLGKTHTDETKKKISEACSAKQSGKSNSQFGTCWINNGEIAKKIKREDLQQWMTLGWRTGRK